MKSQSWDKMKRIIAWIIIICLVVGMFFVFTRQNRSRILRQNENYVQDNARQTAQQIDDILYRSLKDMEMMAYLFGETLETPQVTSSDLKKLTEESGFDYVRFTDIDGHNVTADGRTSDATDREYYLEGIAGKSGMSVTLRSRITNETLVNFYTPLKYKGKIIGVLRGVYLADKRMKQLLSASFFGENSAAFLCASDGTIIARNSATDNKLDNIKTYLADVQNEDQDSIKIVADALENGESTGFHYHVDRGIENGYITKLSGSNWFLVQTFPAEVTNRMYAEANSAGIILEISLIILFFLYIAFLVVTNRKQKQKLLEENRDLGYVIRGIPKLYDKFILIDLEEETYRYMLNEIPDYGRIPKTGTYLIFKEYMLNTVREEDVREQLGSFLELEEICRNIKDETKDMRFDYHVMDGNEEWRRINLVCLERKDGVPTKVLLAKQNITKEKMEEHEKQNILREAKQAAELSSKAKSTFLFNVSHDIRTPMNAIIGFADIADKNIDDTEKVKNCISKIRYSSDVLLKIINDVLDLARIESGKSMLHFTPRNLETEVDGIRDMFMESMEKAGLAFTVEAEFKNPYVICDDLRINQIAINLVNNAQKFTPGGGTVAFRFCQVEDAKDGIAEYEMVVRDTGIGMSEEFLLRVFDAFERERTSTVSGIQGTGLGLSIVKSLVEMMGGTIEIKSRVNKGTEICIHFMFPVITEEEFREGLSISEEKVDFTGKRVLLVEDNELNREIAEEILMQEGFLVEKAEDGVVAVSKVEESQEGYYDLILMDIQMPKMNGYEATKAIRSLPDPKLASIPIMAMTANAFEEDKMAALEAGMNGHIAKPIDIVKMNRELVKVLKNLRR